MNKDISNLPKLRLDNFLWVGLITLTSVALFGGSGYLIDTWIGTKPFGLIIGMVISFPITQIAIYKKIKRDLGK